LEKFTITGANGFETSDLKHLPNTIKHLTINCPCYPPLNEWNFDLSSEEKRKKFILTIAECFPELRSISVGLARKRGLSRELIEETLKDEKYQRPRRALLRMMNDLLP